MSEGPEFEFHRVLAEGEHLHGCAVCGRVLNTFVPVDDFGRQLRSEAEYRHPYDGEYDHAPVPVRYKDIPQQQRGKCDFCGAEAPEWIVPVRSFTPDYGPEAEGGIQDMSVANWAACYTCCGYIRKGQWVRLSDHAARLISAAHPEVPRKTVREQALRIHKQVRRHQSGKPFRLEGPLH